MNSASATPSLRKRWGPALSGHDRSQLLLLPEAVDDYVGPDNAVPAISAAAAALLSEARKSVRLKATSSMLLSMGWILRQRRLPMLSRR